MINNVSLTGRIVNDLDLKRTQNGIEVLSFRLAVDRKFTNASGEREADFINMVVWRKTAEIMAQHLGKGSLIGVEGRLQTRSYEHNEGHTVYVTEVVVNDFAFLEPKSQSQSNNNQGQGNYSSSIQNGSQGNFGGNGGGSQIMDDPFESNDTIADIDDSDLPFSFAPMR